MLETCTLNFCLAETGLCLHQLGVLLSKSLENSIHAVLETGKLFNLRPKDQVAELSVGKENDEEHDGKSSDVFGTAR